MADHDDAPMTREDANMHWALTYLREDLQALRQEMRQEIRDVHRRIDDLSQRMDQRFNRQTATMIALAGAIIAAVKL